MSENIKNYLGTVSILAIILVAVSFAVFVNHYGRSIDPSAMRSFSVSGEGEVVAVPDVAEFSFSVITEGGTDLESLQKENTKKVNAAIGFVKEAGVDDKDIKTESYRVSPRYQYHDLKETGLRPPPEIVGYSISQSVGVKVRDFEIVGGLLSGVIGAGANSVSDLKFTIDDENELKNEARKLAIAQAEEKAKLIAKAAGFRVGRIISISENFYAPFYGRPMMESIAFDTGKDMAPEPIIEPGSEEVKINITLRYEIR